MHSSVGLPTDTTSDLDQRSGSVGWVDHLFRRAVAERASDIHLEPFRNALRVRMRIEGELQNVESPGYELAREITSRIKVLAKLNIAEQRVPQDGHLLWQQGGRNFDIRVSTLPTSFGESVVLRVLDRSGLRCDLPSLGMPPRMVDACTSVLALPHGLIVVAGPTGSGKTTTLYSALGTFDASSTKILTAEDPVEFKTPGLVQVTVDDAIGLSFSRTVRAFLRQDPDVIMIGEVRDAETAQVAVQAALTGHLVLTSLHASSIEGAITRLLDLGVEPFLLSCSLAAVVSQRLVRPSGVGRRIPQFELLVVGEDVRHLILERPTSTALKRAVEQSLIRGDEP